MGSSLCCCCFCCPKQPSEESESVRARTRLPHPKRQCTDLLPLALFVLFWCGMVVVAGYAYLRGDAFRLLNGVDSYGNTCGRKNEPLVQWTNSTADPLYFPLSGQDMSEKKFLFPLDIAHPFDSAWICVEQCPNRTVLNNFSEFHHETNYSYCTPTHGLDGLIHQRYCPIGTIYESDGTILSQCLPNDFVTMAFSTFTSLHKYVRDKQWIREVTSEFNRIRPEIFALCLASIGVSLLGVFLIRFLAPVIVYFIYIMVILVTYAFTVFLWYVWYAATYLSGAAEIASVSKMDAQALMAAESGPNHITLLIGAIAMTVLTVILSYVVWCFWQRGGLVVDLFHECGRALADMPLLLLQPLITCFFLVIFLLYWIFVFVGLQTSAPAISSPINRSNGEMIDEAITFNTTDTIRYMSWYHFVGLVWTTEFIFACHRMVIAGAVALWYFRWDGKLCPWCNSLLNLIGYHLGSVVFGSFIITLVKLPRYILLYFHAKLQASQNAAITCIFHCVAVVLAYIEKFLSYIHHNAYTIIAINGQGFCKAGKTAINLLLDNAVDVATINTVGTCVLFLTKLIITMACFGAAVFRFKIQLALNYWAFEAALIALVAYVASTCCLSVVEMIIDSLFLCFAYDNDQVLKSNGSSDYAYKHFKNYMDTTLTRERELGIPRRWNRGDHRQPAEQIELAPA